jgi:hypothetical protein
MARPKGIDNPPLDVPCELLAELLAGPGALEIARLLALSGLMDQASGRVAVSTPAPPQKPSAEPIGPWIPVLENGERMFVREPYRGTDFVWWKPSFRREAIASRANAGRRRVCLIGESAAAGMFYTPHYTPAIALSRLLATLTNADAFEVIDLTRNSMNATEVSAIAEAALQLHPDDLVVFAGNNWFAGQGLRWEAPPEERRHYSECMANRGSAGIVATFQQRVRDVADRTLEQLGHTASQGKARLLFVVPAVDLSWERVEPLAWLEGTRSCEWYELHEVAARALEACDWACAERSALAMVELDGGSNPTSQRMLGRAQLALGRRREALCAFEAELDHANAYEMFCQSIPGTPSFLRDHIVSRCRQLAIDCIDLRAVFEAHTGSPLEWQRLFLDYCHMTPEGMNVAMAAAASRLAGVDENDVSKRLVSEAEPNLNARIEGVARFYGALCTAHLMTRLLPPEPDELQSKIRAALQRSPEMAEFVRDYLRARNGALVATPMLSASSHRVIAQSNNPFLDYIAVRGVAGVDSAVVTAIGAALDDVGQGGSEALAEYLEYYELRTACGVDLTMPAYIERSGALAPYLKYESERETRRALPIYRSLWPSSAFTLVSRGDADVDVEIVCRAPLHDAAESGVARLSIGHQVLAELPIGGRWVRHRVHIAAAMLRRGCNRLVVTWPSLSTDGTCAFDEAQRRYRLAQPPHVFPVFGELFACKVNATRRRA